MKHKDGDSAFEIRWCTESEIEWVNEQYRKVDFMPSNLNRDRIAIAVYGHERVGLGRLCYIRPLTIELGGMYVEPSYRGMGVAKRIIKFLLEYRDPEATVYCLAFAHLRNFYQDEGFQEVSVEGYEAVPHEILKKNDWCNETYSHKVLLLYLNKLRSQGS